MLYLSRRRAQRYTSCYRMLWVDVRHATLSKVSSSFGLADCRGIEVSFC